MARHDGTHGARPLSRLMAVLLGIVLAVGAAAAVWLLITFPLWWPDAPRIGLPVTIEVGDGQELLPLTTELGEIHSEEWRGELEVKLANPWVQWLYTLVLLGQILLAALILDRLRRVVAAFARGAGLSRNTAGDLRWAGGLMLIESVVTPAIAAAVSTLVIGRLSTPDVVLEASWSSGFSQHGFLAGWVLIILSAALSQGADLRDEQSLTV